MLEQIARRVRRALGRPRIRTRDVHIGKDVKFGKNVRFNCSRIRIGDGVVIGNDVRVDSTVFEIGDFGTIYPGCFFPGPGELRIGHNFWLGAGAIVDCQGGTRIGNNVGVGAHSQLWTHMKFGDTLQGCRFDLEKPLTIEDDVWFVGHCLVSPITARARSMALLGSLVSRDMEADHTYAGVPAVDVTERFGSQFADRSLEEKRADLRKRIEQAASRIGLSDVDARVRIVASAGELDGLPPGVIGFDIASRSYRKTGTPLERRLLRRLLPGAKFLPR